MIWPDFQCNFPRLPHFLSAEARRPSSQKLNDTDGSGGQTHNSFTLAVRSHLGVNQPTLLDPAAKKCHLMSRVGLIFSTARPLGSILWRAEPRRGR